MKKSGFTLIEVLVASLISGLVMAAMLASFDMSRRLSNTSYAYNLALHEEARICMEEYVLPRTYETLPYGSYSNLTGMNPATSYAVSNNLAFPQTKDVVVTAYWTDPKTRTDYSVSLATSISKALHFAK